MKTLLLIILSCIGIALSSASFGWCSMDLSGNSSCNITAYSTCDSCGGGCGGCGGGCCAYEGCAIGCGCSDLNCGRNPCLSCGDCCAAFGNIGAR